MTHKKNTTRKLGSRVKTPGQRSQSTRLVELASGAELFHTPDREPFATIHLQGHPETWPVRSQEFRGWLERRFYLQERRAPSSTAVKDASNLLAARARFDGAEREVFVRVAEHDEIYVDLGNQSRKALRISARGYEVVSNPPVKFRRASGMLALPYPAGHGRIGSLRPFLNVAENDQWLLLLGWLIGAFSPRGPYPLLVLQGEQGSAKSTTARVLRALIDPHTAPLRGVPRETRDLMISAINSWVQVFDNLSRLPADLSDDLCRLSTGGGLATRALYTDTDEVFLAAQRPVILTGIEGLVTRPDLLDRAIIIYLPNVLDRARRAEREFWQGFEKARPRILGALLKAVSTALRRLPRVRLAEAPRMADFARWVTAAEPALGLQNGEFLKAYARNIESAVDLALEFSPVAIAICDLVEEESALALVPEPGRDTTESAWTWVGTARVLLQQLEDRDPGIKQQRGWPRSAGALSYILRRMAPVLRRRGIILEFDRREGHESRRIISLKKSEENLDRVDRKAAPARQEVDDDPLPDIAVDAVDDLPIIFTDPDPPKQGVHKATGTPSPRPATRKVRRRRR